MAKNKLLNMAKKLSYDKTSLVREVQKLNVKILVLEEENQKLREEIAELSRTTR